MTLRFTKLHGIGNDFVLIDDLGNPAALSTAVTPELACRLCDRHFGVGADQVLWMRPPQSQSASARMEILNPDGSTAEMCGNGIRAAALYLYLHGPKPKQDFYEIETLAGVKSLEIRMREGAPWISVDMGVPILGAKAKAPKGETLTLRDGSEISFIEVNMGNPHAVIFLNELERYPAAQVGNEIEHHSRFKNRTNVEFVQVISPEEIRVRVWERGTGLTLACGTGACASAVASMLTQQAGPALKVHLPGGTLIIRWAGEGRPVMMEGPAEEVFHGEFRV